MYYVYTIANTSNKIILQQNNLGKKLVVTWTFQNCNW